MQTPRLRWVLAPLAAALLIPQAAMADITPKRTDAEAKELAQAISVDPSVVTDARFSTITPKDALDAAQADFDPAALATTALATFPRNGDSYAILSTGDAKLADDEN